MCHVEVSTCCESSPAHQCLCRLSNDFLLPTMITFLNDRDWQTRAAFFREVPCMAAQAGFAGMEAFLLPCVEQAGLSLVSRDQLMPAYETASHHTKLLFLSLQAHRRIFQAAGPLQWAAPRRAQSPCSVPSTLCRLAAHLCKSPLCLHDDHVSVLTSELS